VVGQGLERLDLERRRLDARRGGERREVGRAFKLDV
jgi:hypothetical protein